jgi:hypothetical protein
MSDRWLRDARCSVPAEVREGVEAWRAAGVRTVIVAVLDARRQMKAFEELIAAFR